MRKTARRKYSFIYLFLLGRFTERKRYRKIKCSMLSQTTSIAWRWIGNRTTRKGTGTHLESWGLQGKVLATISWYWAQRCSFNIICFLIHSSASTSTPHHFHVTT